MVALICITTLTRNFVVYREDEHFCCSGRRHGIDMDAARDGYGRLRAMPNKHVAEVVCCFYMDTE